MCKAQYGRISTSAQHETSIEDQKTKCLELLTAKKLGVDQVKFYSDEAISGSSRGVGKRNGFRKMMYAVEEGEIKTVVADELSRLFRNFTDAGTMYNLAENAGLHVLTCDGIDTHTEGWQNLWHLKLMMSMEEVRRTASRTQRTMKGTLERGLMTGPAPLGYRISPYRRDANGKELQGAQWEFDEAGKALVCRIFEMRKTGMSEAGIAGKLNAEGIPNPGHDRKGAEHCYWRPATVDRILKNSIYKGEYIHHGSANVKAQKRRRNEKWEPTTFLRPKFRIISDELWEICNPPQTLKRYRNGDRYMLAGILRCATCGASLSTHDTGKTRAMHCPQCEQAVRVGEPRAFLGYTTEKAGLLALEAGLKLVFSDEVMAEFRKRLERRLAGDSTVEVESLKKEIRECDAIIARLIPMLSNLRLPVEQLQLEMEKHTEVKTRAEKQLKELTEGSPAQLKSTIRKQLAVDPRDYIGQLLKAEEVALHEVRATLRRLIEEFVFLGKQDKFHSHFKLKLAPGLAIGLQSGTHVIDAEAIEVEVHVRCGARRPVQWDVSVIRIK
jgi:DNA invertase Pin-like site-specific DNA recombinase